MNKIYCKEINYEIVDFEIFNYKILIYWKSVILYEIL